VIVWLAQGMAFYLRENETPTPALDLRQGAEVLVA